MRIIFVIALLIALLGCTLHKYYNFAGEDESIKFDSYSIRLYMEAYPFGSPQGIDTFRTVIIIQPVGNSGEKTDSNLLTIPHVDSLMFLYRPQMILLL
jgi:hypothetical protein